MNTAVRRKRAPTVSVDVDVSLDEFGIDEIREWLKSQGEDVDDGEGLYIGTDDLNRIETLAVCGQQDEARKFALSIISKAIQRPL